LLKDRQNVRKKGRRVRKDGKEREREVEKEKEE